MLMSFPKKVPTNVVALKGVKKENRVLVENSIPFSPELATRVGVCGALILQQIHYWTGLNLHIREGHSWVYKTYEDLVQDIRMYDVSTVKRSLAKLKDAKVIVVGKGMNKEGYDKTNWYRVDKSALKTLMQNDPTIGSKCPYPLGQNDPTIGSKCPYPLGQNDPIHKVILTQPIPETTAETTAETTLQLASEVASSSQHEIQGEFKVYSIPEIVVDTVVEIKEELNMDALDIMKKFEQDSKSVKVKTRSTGVQAMTLAWKKAVALEVGGYVKPFTGKEIGQLQHVYKALGESALPCLYFALGDWQSFALEVGVQTGMTPAMNPNIGFFCAHHHVALNLMNKPKPQKGNAVVITQSIAVKPVVPTTLQTKVCDNGIHEPKATTDDVKASLEALATVVAKTVTPRRPL